MGRISTGIGLVSGINSKDIIDQLIKLESGPRTCCRFASIPPINQRIAYTDLQARLSSIRIFGQTIQKTQTFAAATATSSDEKRPHRTAAKRRVGRRISVPGGAPRDHAAVRQQRIQPTSTPKVGAGTITIEQGGGEVSSPTLLSQLRGGQGITARRLPHHRWRGTTPRTSTSPTR